MATTKEILERVTETNQKIDAIDQKLDDYKERQIKVYAALEKRVSMLENRHDICRAETVRKIDDLRPERRRDRTREWLVYLLTIAGVFAAIVLPIALLIQRVSELLQKTIP